MAHTVASLKKLITAFLANGMYEREYHKEAKNWTKRRSTRMRSRVRSSIPGTKQMIRVKTRQVKYVIVVHFRLSSNMFLNCLFGPTKNIDELSAKILPMV